jgi:hypothetical protein
VDSADMCAASYWSPPAAVGRRAPRTTLIGRLWRALRSLVGPGRSSAGGRAGRPACRTRVRYVPDKFLPEVLVRPQTECLEPVTRSPGLAGLTGGLGREIDRKSPLSVAWDFLSHKFRLVIIYCEGFGRWFCRVNGNWRRL